MGNPIQRYKLESVYINSAGAIADERITTIHPDGRVTLDFNRLNCNKYYLVVDLEPMTKSTSGWSSDRTGITEHFEVRNDTWIVKGSFNETIEATSVEAYHDFMNSVRVFISTPE